MATRANSTPAPAVRRLAAAPLTIYPTFAQRALAHLASGSLPPLLAGGYVAAVTLAGFGLGLMMAGGLL